MILEAEIINDEPLEAEIITGGNDSPSDVYKGEYTVIPGPNEQILKTKDLVLRKDVTVKAIPDGYVIPEGTLEVAENGVYNVAGYKLAEVKVPDTGGSGEDLTEIEEIIDESGVLDSTEGSIEEKVDSLIDKAEQARLWGKAVFKGGAFQNLNSPFISFAEKTIPKIDFSQITSLLYTFSGASIEYINYYINSENATNFNSCFASCKNLVRLVGVNTSSATTLTEMFLNCTSLESITVPFNLSKATNVNKAFNGCENLKEICFVAECIKVSIGIPNAIYLTAESIQSIIDGLATVSTAQTLTLHKNITLTDEQKATIYSKGWTLAQ